MTQTLLFLRPRALLAVAVLVMALQVPSLADGGASEIDSHPGG